MVIEFTGFERPRRIQETVHMSSMDLQGAVTFEPVPQGTRMRWSWEVEPRGILKLMSPLVARTGRRQEQRIWTSLKHLLEGQGTDVGIVGRGRRPSSQYPDLRRNVANLEVAN